jgi:molybdopterin synthase catalytic subunit
MYHLTREHIDLGAVVASVGDSSAGATATFIGVTRDHNDGRDVRFLEYEAYGGMAEQEMERIGREAADRWSICKIAIVHRTGRVPIGEASVAIAVSAAHRAEAFAACRFAIDRLKESVPIWKKEHFEGGDVWIGHAGGGAGRDPHRAPGVAHSHHGDSSRG